VDLGLEDLELGYRDSVLKRSMVGAAGQRASGSVSPRWVVLEVTLELDQQSSEVKYSQLAQALGCSLGALAPASEIRQAVLQIRRAKGMVLESEDHDTWSAGSFFTNPVLSQTQDRNLDPDAPRFPAPGGVKTSAAWLIQQTGVQRGWGVRPGARATTSTKHVLALTNRGGATVSDVLELAEQITLRVQRRFGITLVPEPTLVN
jgi:UDP-N-acetylmuramate dehydrogenase